MQACTERVRHQLTNEHTRIVYVLETSDATLLVFMEMFEEDTMTTGNRNNFQSTVADLLPKDPLARHQNNCKNCNQAQISDTYAQGQGFVSKFFIGNTGVHFI